MKVRALLPALALALAAFGCATPMVQVEHRRDGILHVSCKASLPECLTIVEAACEHQRYAVLRAFDDHDLRGDTVTPADIRLSEVFVRCDRNAGWSRENSALRASPLDVPPPAPALVPAPGVAAPLPAPARACVPGSTLTCVGPAGCAGGQVCSADGASYGPCDCGPAKPVSPP